MGRRILTKAVLATIPVFLLFAVLQRWVSRGFGLSGLK